MLFYNHFIELYNNKYNIIYTYFNEIFQNIINKRFILKLNS